jgi:hypothetical protein
MVPVIVPPIFGHSPETGVASGLAYFTPPAPPSAPAMPHLAPRPDHRAVAWSERPSGRRAAGADGVMLGAYVGGALTQIPPDTAAQEAEERAAKLDRARQLLASHPDAIRQMQRHVLNTFRAMVSPPITETTLILHPAPVLRLAVYLHQLRLDCLDAQNDETRLILLCDAEAAMRRHVAYSDRESRRMEADDRANAVALIASLWGSALPGNRDLDETFFNLNADEAQ